MSVTGQHISDIPTYIFGAGSTLIEPTTYLATPVAEGVSLAIKGVAFIVVILYLMWLNHWGVRGSNHQIAFRFLGYHRGDYSLKLSLLGPSFKRYSQTGTLVGFLTIWVVVAALLGVGNIVGDTRIGVLLLFAIAAIYIYQLLIINLLGVVTNNLEFTAMIVNIKKISFVLLALSGTPIALCYLLARGTMQDVFEYVIGIQLLIIVLVFIYEIFLLFITKKVSLLHTILYLCAVEIFPLSLIWGFFNR